MQLSLKKSLTDTFDPKRDNANKRELFPKGLHPRSASVQREEWAFIKDETLRENISYQMQYLEHLVNLYNEYRIYLTVESLLCKDILSTVGGIVEAALFDVVQASHEKAGTPMGARTDFVALLGEAHHALGVLDSEMWHYFHELRKVRNFVHLKAADFREHTAYTVDEANEALKMLERFRLSLITD